jgi:hypothetical protein
MLLKTILGKKGEHVLAILEREGEREGGIMF